mmetsp:Transcript_31495/g.76187  ORF Transcript_31495/g.76187 Transcript_31495/m.76187 type:complete len:259 (+) Transcript_31495:701-1477(+)
MWPAVGYPKPVGKSTDLELGDVGLCVVFHAQLRETPLGRHGAEHGGIERKTVCHSHQRCNHLPCILLPLLGVFRCQHLVKGVFSADIDDTDPVVRGVLEQRLALDHHPDPPHQGGRQRLEALHKLRVACCNHFLVASATVEGEGRPVWAPQDNLVGPICSGQLRLDSQELPECQLCRSVGGKDRVHRPGSVRRDQPPQALWRGEVVLLPSHELLKQRLCLGILAEMFPYRLQELIDRSDKALFQARLVELARQKVLPD